MHKPGRSYSYHQITILSILLSLLSCQPECGFRNPTDVSDLLGSYEGSTEAGKRVSFQILPLEDPEWDFQGEDLRDISYPFVPLKGRRENRCLWFEEYVCEQCDFLPSPGGTPRRYTASLTATGEWKRGSLTMEILYEQTGDITDQFKGRLLMEQVE